MLNQLFSAVDRKNVVEVMSQSVSVVLPSCSKKLFGVTGLVVIFYTY